MGIDGWITLGVVLSVLILLFRNIAPSDIVFMGAVVILALCGIITPREAFIGFTNSGMLTVAFLFIVAAGLRETGVLEVVGHNLLGRAKTAEGVLGRLALAILPSSAFLNNTPVVSMFVPIVLDWCRRNQIAPSRLLIPVSYLAILGGTCTLIGTSTNLVVNGLMRDRGIPGMTLFELSPLGIPYALIGFGFLYWALRNLLPDRKEMIEQLGEARREYLAEMLIEPKCRLVGQTVEAAGLRNLPGLFLIEIDREGEVIGPVAPQMKLEANDRLVFTGIVSSILELERIPGLTPVSDPHYEVSPRQQRGRVLCEAVISTNSPLIGLTVREADFRAAYGAAVVAVHRGGQRVERKIGEIRLRPGDTLLMQTAQHFLRTYRNDPAFYLISNVDDWRAMRRDRHWIALIIFAALLVFMTGGWIPLEITTAAAAILMVGFGCLSASDARNSVEWQVLVTIAAALAVGVAIENSGAAQFLADQVFRVLEPGGPWVALAGVYLITMLVTELITNNAAAALVFPFCLKIAELYQASERPFIMALIMAASASFITPIGYQTNMMVFGPGGYRFTDFFRVGTPLSLILWITAVVLIPWIWPFFPTR